LHSLSLSLSSLLKIYARRCQCKREGKEERVYVIMEEAVMFFCACAEACDVEVGAFLCVYA